MLFSVDRYFKKLRSIVIGVVIISFLPTLFYGLNLQKDMKVWEYTVRGRTFSLFPDIFSQFFYSMTIFFSALIVGLVSALILTFFSTLLPKPLQRIIYGFLTLLESLPDLFIVIILQISVVYIYKETGWLISNVSSLYDNPIYLFPIIVLSILPTIQLFKITFLLMQEEQHKPYVTIARSMGLGKLYITLKHVFRNIIMSLFQYSKIIFVFMLSNLFIMEYVFYLNGIMSVMLRTQGIAFIITVLMIAVPFSLLFEIIENYMQAVNKHKKEVDAA